MHYWHGPGHRIGKIKRTPETEAEFCLHSVPEGTRRSLALAIGRQLANMMLTLACENAKVLLSAEMSEMPETRNTVVPPRRARRNTS